MVATIIDVAKNVDTQKQLFRVHLRLRKRLASEPKARIYAAANELNYTPNPIARAMARQKTDNITFVIHENQYPASESVLFVGFGSDHAGNDETELWPFCHYK